MIFLNYFLLFVLAFGGCQFHQASGGTFEVDYTNNCFRKDGQPFRYISGEVHYFRIHPGLWEDRLKRIRAMGLNVIQVYVPWNLHEPEPGNFDFSGGLDVVRFFQLAQQNQLYVNLRAGPYICAEWENGGLPWWLLKYEGITMRTADANYTYAVQRYYNKLFSVISPLLYKNGGNILMVQVENEYGSYYACDHTYLAYLRDLFRGLLGNDTVLYTTDGAGVGYLKCGAVPGTFPTVDFGVTSDSGIDGAFKAQQEYSKGGPNVNSEYYPGWFGYWGQTSESLPTGDQIVKNLDYMYNHKNASMSIYMIHGGTNFGFQNGAETDYPIITSYDYGAPISENGDINEKYQAIRAFIKGLPNWPNPPLDIPANNPAYEYGKVPMKRLGGSLLSVLSRIQGLCVNSIDPLTFEDLNHGYGYVLYSTTLKSSGKTLNAPNIKDYGYVFVNDVFQGHFNRDKQFLQLSISIKAQPGDVLRILVENRGRKTYETINDYKGLHKGVTLDSTTLQNWVQCSINLTQDSVSSLTSTFFKKEANQVSHGPEAISQPGVYVGTFDASVIQDTFFNSSGWGKGQFFLNGNNIGRYWPLAGPQITLYTPSPYVQQKNTVMLIELLGAQQNFVTFTNHTIYNYKKYEFGTWHGRPGKPYN